MSGDSRERLRPGQNLLLGAVSGAATKCLNYPLLHIKNRRAAGNPVEWKIRTLYRGAPMAVANLSSTSAVQYWLSSGCYEVLSYLKPSEQASHLTQKFLGTLIGCSLSGLWCGPFELCMIKQTYSGAHVFRTVADIVGALGPSGLFRGAVPAMAREGVFGTCMLFLCPWMREHISALQLEASLALAFSSLATAIFASTVTMPLDCIKTCMQTDHTGRRFTNMRQTFRTLVAERGVPRLFAGNVWRISLISTTFYLIHYFNDYFAPILFPLGALTKVL